MSAGLSAGNRRLQPRPDRLGARGRQLLADDDAGKPLEAGSRLRSGGTRALRDEPRHHRVAPRERLEAAFEDGLRIEDQAHRRGGRLASLQVSASIAPAASVTQPVFRFAPESRTAGFISATPIPPCSTRTLPRARAAACCCASRTSTSPAAGRSSRPASTRTSPGSGSPGRAGAAAVGALRRRIGRRSARLRGMGLSTRASARAGRSPPPCADARRPRRRPWPRDPDGAPLYPGTCRGLTIARGGRAASRRGEALRLAARRWTRRPARRPPLAFHPLRRRTAQETRRARRTGALGRRRHRPQGDPDELPSCCSCRRRPAGRDPRRARAGPRGGDRPACAAADAARPADAAYHHHDLVKDEAGHKLSKSLLSEPLAALRARGVTPEAIRSALGFAPRPVPGG